MMRNDTRSQSYISGPRRSVGLRQKELHILGGQSCFKNSFIFLPVEMKRRQSTDIDNEAAASGDINVHYKRERRKARKVIVERLRRERIDRCLEQLKQWLQGSTPPSAAVMQGDLCNLEKADILELTVNHLRQMVASTEMQYSVGYSACVQEVNNFLISSRYDDVTRRRIVQHLCRRQQFLVASAPTTTGSDSLVSGSRCATDVESDSSPSDYQHLRMCSYSSAADSTTGGGEAFEPAAATELQDGIPSVEYQPTCTSPLPEPDQSSVNTSPSRFSGAALVNESENRTVAGPTNSKCHRSMATVDECIGGDKNNNQRDCDEIDEWLLPVWRPW